MNFCPYKNESGTGFKDCSLLVLLLHSLPTEFSYTCVNEDYFVSQ